MQIKMKIFSTSITVYYLFFPFYLTLPLPTEKLRCLKVASLSLGARKKCKKENNYSLMLYECGTVGLEN